MSTVQEIEAAIPKLSRAELQKFHAWYEEYIENHLELNHDVKAKLDESHREIAAGNHITRQPERTFSLRLCVEFLAPIRKRC